MKGIYLIKCSVDNKVYIGQSNNINKRYISHLSELRHGKHSNCHLQDAFDKYGEDSFVCEVVFQVKDECFDVDKLNQLETYYISLYDSTNRLYGYNIESGGKSSKIVSDDTRKKLSESHKGKLHSEATKKKFSKIRKGKPSHLKGKKQSKEHIDKRTNKQIGKVWVNNGIESRFVSKSEANTLLTKGFVLGRPFIKRVKGKRYLFNGEMYTISQISQICGIDSSVLHYRLKSGWDMNKATSSPVKK